MLANRIVEDLRSRVIPHPHSPSGFVTVSIGCATVYPEYGRNSAQLVDMADRALYSAKRAGRDCVFPLHDIEQQETVSSPS